MKSNWIPSGKKGSINDLAMRSLEDREGVIMEVCDKPYVALNIIDTLQNHVSSEEALNFATDYIKFKI